VVLPGQFLISIY